MLRCLITLVALLLAAPTRAADGIMVVATFSVIADMLANVGGDHINIKTIVGAGGDCELYQPTAADIATVASARAVFINDLNEEFEPWLEPLLKQATFKGTKLVVTRGVRTLTAEEEHPVSGRQLPAAIDQHAWLDPSNGIVYVRNVADALARLDPGNAADYRARGGLHEADPGGRWLGAQGDGRRAGRQAAGAHFARFAAVPCKCLRHHVADGERLDQQERTLSGGAGEADAANSG
jgi:zinc/manganese transport system substrate-binding protein